ncbi:MAG: hypothetical protein R6V55_10995, partial [Desulfovermiculus sp.]
ITQKLGSQWSGHWRIFGRNWLVAQCQRHGYNLYFILIDIHPNFIQQLNNLQSPGGGSVKEYISGDVVNIEGLFRKTVIQSTLKAETGCSLQYFSQLNIAELEKSDPQMCSQLYAILLRNMIG